MKVNLQIALNHSAQHASLPLLEDFQSWSEVVDCGDSEVCVRIVEEDESAELNQYYRQQASPTNVLAFPFQSPLADKTNYLGDVVIAASLVDSEAREQGKDPKSHWAHLFVHGLLHLRGYDHQNDESASEMQAHETQILNSLGFPDPYNSKLSRSVDE